MQTTNQTSWSVYSTDMNLMRIVMGEVMGKRRGDEGRVIINSSCRKKLSGRQVGDGKHRGKQDQDSTSRIIIPNAEQVLKHNLSKCEVLVPLNLKSKERNRDSAKKTLYENGTEVEHTKNWQPPRSMHVNIIIPSSDFKSAECDVGNGRDLMLTEEWSEECSGKEESPYQSPSERLSARVLRGVKHSTHSEGILLVFSLRCREIVVCCPSYPSLTY